MIKKFYTRLSLILMLAAAAPMLSPAFPVRAAARVSSAETSPVRLQKRGRIQQDRMGE